MMRAGYSGVSAPSGSSGFKSVGKHKMMNHNSSKAVLRVCLFVCQELNNGPSTQKRHLEAIILLEGKERRF